MTSAEIDALWDYSDPAASEARFRDLLAAEADESVRHEIRTQIARTLGLQRKFDEAQAEIDRVPAPGQGKSTVSVRRDLEQGRILNSSGRKVEARPYFESALDSAVSLGLDFHAVDAAHMLGILAEGEESLDWNLKAIEMAKASPDERAQNWQGSLLNNTGWSLHDLGRYQEAHDLFVQAVAFRERQGKPNLIRIAHWCVGRSLRSLGRYDEALQIQERILSGGGDEGYASEEMGELLLVMGREEESKSHFATAYEKLSQDAYLAEHEPDRIERLKSLS